MTERVVRARVESLKAYQRKTNQIYPHRAAYPCPPKLMSTRVRTSESHSRRTSPSQVYGSYDSLLCRTPFQKTVINCFLFTNRFRCTIKEKHHLVWCFFFYIVPKGNEQPFALRIGTCCHSLKLCGNRSAFLKLYFVVLVWQDTVNGMRIPLCGICVASSSKPSTHPKRNA